MVYIEQFIMSFIPSLCFGIILNAPRRILIPCGLIGGCAWIVTYATMQAGTNVAIATFLGTLMINFLCVYFSRRQRVPAIILSIPGIVPLVPGGPAYTAVRYAVESRYIESFEQILIVIYVSGAIAVGFMVGNLVESKFTHYLTRNRLTRTKQP